MSRCWGVSDFFDYLNGGDWYMVVDGCASFLSMNASGLYGRVGVVVG